MRYLKTEKFVPPADGHNTTGQFSPSVHGFTGAVSVSLPGFPTALDNRVMATTRELSAEFPFNLDMNGGSPLGVGWSQGSIGGAKRSSSATAYIQSGQINRPNLHVLINAQVTKLAQTGTVLGLPSFHSVQFTSQKGGKEYSFYAHTLSLTMPYHRRNHQRWRRKRSHPIRWCHWHADYSSALWNWFQGCFENPRHHCDC
jgi:hypothetical protein